METHFGSYLKLIEEESPNIPSAIQTTVDSLIPNYIQAFTYREHITGLLLGNVQSGKTSHVFGLISAAADESFECFIFLTTDNVHLHKQTLQRAFQFLDTFTVCGEDDEMRFLASQMRKPVIIVLKKNAKVLQRWKNILASSDYFQTRALFIVDDEGDAASLNTKINKKEQSAINMYLEGIKKVGNSSMYMQVTATPQSLLLQSVSSEWRPAFVYYFPPGVGYLGGDFFYSDPPSQCIRLTPEDELDDLRSDEDAEGLKQSLFSFLITSAHLFQKNKWKACNYLVHPSVRIADHKKLAIRIGEYLNQMLTAISEDQMSDYLRETWDDLLKTKHDLISFDEAYAFIKNILNETNVNIKIMNSTGDSVVDASTGINIIIGGNSLGRGVTFPALQTVYYCRTSKSPQADTFWQHCRMFGYDRDPDLMRIFIPPSLLKLFIELNSSNRALLSQVINGSSSNVGLLYPPKIKPTRSNVIDKDILEVIVGGVNHFPEFPNGKYLKELDSMLSSFTDEKGKYEITLNNVISLLGRFESERKGDWSNTAFINSIKALKAAGAENKAYLIVRRDRNITKGTGTLLSPDDREMGNEIKNYTVLTLYRVTGDVNKKWDGKSLWIPNIKLPEGKNFYKVDR